MSFESLGLRAELLRAVHEHTYDTPTQVQAFAIPHILEGRDLLAAAETGSGKTAGFTLPLLQRLMALNEASLPAPNPIPGGADGAQAAATPGLEQAPQHEPSAAGSAATAAEEEVAEADAASADGERSAAPAGATSHSPSLAGAIPSRPPRALILVPTRELCAQVTENVRGYGRHLPLRCVQIFGGVGMQPQVVALKSGVDIIIATPGRLLDHIQRGSVDLSGIRILVLDEADRMLDMGFIDVIRRVIAHLPPARQNLLFSATLGDDVQALADSLLDQPETIQVTPKARPVEAIEQVFYDVEPPHKADALAHLFHERGWPQALIFTRTKHGADRLAKKLYRAGITSDSIHGNKGQGARTRALTRFKNAEIAALVATDVAARGIDIDGLPQVVNFDLPHVPEDYLHRIGRTGRVGEIGHAISLVSLEEQRLLQAIARLLGTEFAVQPLEGFVPRVLPPREPREQRDAPARDDAALDEDGVELDGEQIAAFASTDGDDGQAGFQDRDANGRRNRRRRRGRGRAADAPRTPVALLPSGGILEAFVEGDDDRQPAALGGQEADDDAYYDDEDDTQPAWLSQQAAAFDPVDDDEFDEVDDEDNIGNRIIDPPQDFRARSPFAGQGRTQGRNQQQQRPNARAPGGPRGPAPGERQPRFAGPSPSGDGAGQAAGPSAPRGNGEARARQDGQRGRSRRNRRGGPRTDGQPNAATAQGADVANGNAVARADGEARAPRPPRAEGAGNNSRGNNAGGNNSGGNSAGGNGGGNNGGRRGRQRFRDRPRAQGDGPTGDAIGNVAQPAGDARPRNAGRPANRNRNGGQAQAGGNRQRRQGRAVEITHGASRRRFGFPSDWSKNINTGPKERLDYVPAPLRASSWEGGAPSGDFLRKVDGPRVAPKIIERKKGRRLLTLKPQAETPSEG